jgi:hypothetical protein
MFHYNGPNCNTNPEECPDGLHLYYNYASDNFWEHETISSITNTANSCVLNPNGYGRQDDWVGLNNFVSPPSQDAAMTLNSYDTAKTYIDQCSQILGTDINFLITDFWSEGELPRMTQDHNTARAAQRRRLLEDRRSSLRKGDNNEMQETL